MLHARRWTEVDDEMRRLLLGEWGHAPAPVDPVALAAAERDARPTRDASRSLEQAREEAGSLAASEEELCLVALFGERRPAAAREPARPRGRTLGDEDALDDDEARARPAPRCACSRSPTPAS